MPVSVLEMLSEPGGAGANEDAAGAVGGLGFGAAWVLDGATGLAGREFIPGAASDAQWYARELGCALSRLSLGSDNPAEIFRRALIELEARYGAAVGGVPVPAYGLPSASGVWLRWRVEGADCHLEFAALGDCKALLRPAGGPARVLGGKAAERWSDARVNRAVRQLQDQGILDTGQRFERMTAALRQFRANMNKPGGYWIFGVDPEAANHLLTESLTVSRPALVLLASDGFYRLVDTYRTFDDDSLVTAAAARGLEALHGTLVAIEGQDAGCRRYPRLKPADDASALLLRITPSGHNRQRRYNIRGRPATNSLCRIVSDCT